MPLPPSDPDPRDIAAATSADARRIRQAAEAGTVPPGSAHQLARLLDTIATTLNSTSTEPPDDTPDDTSGDDPQI